MAGLGKVDGVLHGLAGADLTDQDHVRCLPQGVDQGVVPRVRIDTDLALRDQAVGVLMHELDRVFDGDDVTVCMFVAMADHGRQRRGLAGAGAADDQDQAALGQDQVFQDGRQAELFESWNLGRDDAQHRADAPLLDEDIDAKPANAGWVDREVALLGGIELANLVIVHDRAHQRRGLLRLQRLLGQRRQFAVDLARRRKVRRDEQVRALARQHRAQAIEHVFSGLLAIHDATSSRR